MTAYQHSFRQSRAHREPYGIVAAFTVAGEGDAHAMRSAAPYLLGKVWIRGGRRFHYFPDQVAARRHVWTESESSFASSWAAAQFVGGPELLRRRLNDLVSVPTVREFMALTLVPYPTNRLTSYRRLAEMVAPAASPAPASGWRNA